MNYSIIEYFDSKGEDNMMGSGMMGGGGFGGFGTFGIIGLVLNLVITIGVIVGIVWLVVWLVRRLGTNGQSVFTSMPTSQTPREILQTRYARGEITRDQYQEILADVD
jgi:putative membrane protein